MNLYPTFAVPPRRPRRAPTARRTRRVLCEVCKVTVLKTDPEAFFKDDNDEQIAVCSTHVKEALRETFEVDV